MRLGESRGGGRNEQRGDSVSASEENGCLFVCFLFLPLGLTNYNIIEPQKTWLRNRKPGQIECCTSVTSAFWQRIVSSRPGLLNRQQSESNLEAF